MKTKLLKLAMTVMCACLFASPLSAQGIQPVKVYNPSGKQIPGVTFASSSQAPQPEAQSLTNKNLRKIEGGDCTVTLNLEYDPEQFMAPFMAYIVGSETIAIAGDFEGTGTMQARVPEGTYDIVAYFTKELAQYYTIKEQVEVNGDMEIALNPEECTNRIRFKCYGPNGELLKLGLGHYDEENDEWVHDEDGDIDAAYITNVVYLKGVTSFGASGIGFFGDMLSEEDRVGSMADVFVNEVSDRFLFTQSRISFFEEPLINGKKTFYCSWLSTDNVKCGEVANDPDDFALVSDTYKYTPYGRSVNGYGFGAVLWRIEGGKYGGYDLSTVATHAPKQGDTYTSETWACIPDRDPHYPQLELLMQNNFADYEGMLTNPWTGEETLGITGWTYGTPISVKDGQIERVNLGHQLLSSNSLTINPIYMDQVADFFRAIFTPAPVAFSYPVEQALGIINDNCPINALYVINYENEGQINLNGITNCYVGRNGETRWCNEGFSSTIKCNGEVLESPTFNPNEKANFEITTTNPNIEVDGLPGCNTTTVYFDQNNEDMTPPCVEMLHFKNAEGYVTDRFATAADGMMEFYAGDFHYQYFPEMWSGLFKCQPAEVTVEYAPYGSDAWAELAVEEVPELYQEPGWGYFYRGSLAAVTGTAEKGWFDLRFRLRDESGNWMNQVVSPAFRIDDMAYSSVANVGSGSAREVARYNMAGQRVDEATPGVAIIKMSDGTVRKVLAK